VTEAVAAVVGVARADADEAGVAGNVAGHVENDERLVDW